MNADSLVDDYNGKQNVCVLSWSRGKKKSHFSQSYSKEGDCYLPVLILGRILAVDWALTQQYSPTLRLPSLLLHRVGGSEGLQGSLLANLRDFRACPDRLHKALLFCVEHV